MLKQTMRRRIWNLALLATALLSGAAAQDTPATDVPPLTVEQAYMLARARSPLLRAAAAVADAAATREASAGLPRDPMLQVGMRRMSRRGRARARAGAGRRHHLRRKT